MSRPATVTETHVSTIVFLGDRAYKIKKPVTFGFLDFADRRSRAAACRREVELNRRIAPDVYLGVGRFVGPGDADHADRDDDGGEPVVVMRWLPAERSLAALIAAGEAIDDEIRRIAHTLVTFHLRAARGPAIDADGTAAALARRWEHNLAGMRPLVGPLFDPEDAAAVEQGAQAFIDGRNALFDARIAGGWVCDGHGDLQAADIYCLPDGPRVLDCIEFDDSLRHVDVADDVAFLAMDLERLGAPAAASSLVRTYAQLAGHPLPAALVHHYVAYRAQVRALVTGLRHDQADEAARPALAADARALLAQCRSHLDAGAVRLVLVGGLPGTGKSTLAAGLGARERWTVLRTDEIRRELPAGEGVDRYEPAQVAAVYDEVRRRAGALLDAGESVVLDATFSSAHERRAARRLAAAHGAACVELRCELDAAVAARRMAERAATGTDPSEATPAVAATLAATADPWPESHRVPTDGAPAAVVAGVAHRLGLRAPTF